MARFAKKFALSLNRTASTRQTYRSMAERNLKTLDAFFDGVHPAARGVSPAQRTTAADAPLLVEARKPRIAPAQPADW